VRRALHNSCLVIQKALVPDIPARTSLKAAHRNNDSRSVSRTRPMDDIAFGNRTRLNRSMRVGSSSAARVLADARQRLHVPIPLWQFRPIHQRSITPGASLTHMASTPSGSRTPPIPLQPASRSRFRRRSVTWPTHPFSGCALWRALQCSVTDYTEYESAGSKSPEPGVQIHAFVFGVVSDEHCNARHRRAPENG